ncbi:adenosylcobinamide-GDP ribazoletransferase [Rhodoferax ferrireducens]|uniref:adenosylcobinamide-GDP ribazoletransferase n=1 Tax=Rhodoferax ferrireducens TaxID=192843 RepID=UPI000E0DAAF8|nr:adenosylcobinamide-GDP ribazoletransferase [Rhodoferax ferrireducens]
MTQFLRHYLLAVQFFTRIPVTGRLADWVGFSPAMLRASAAHFPGVGWLVGALVAGFSALLLAGLPDGGFSPLVVAVWGTAFGILITGAFHEDGLADVADGLGGSPDRERALIIMKDSRVGAFGAIAVVLALLAKVSLLALLGSVTSLLLCPALFMAHVVSRTWPLLLIRLMPHVGDAAGSKSKPLADQISKTSLLIAFIWCFTALALVFHALIAIEFIAFDDDALAWITSLATALAASGIAFFVMWRWFWKRLQGFTGDCLGATQQACELAFYLGLALSL